MANLDEIERLVREIEQLEAATNGQFHQAEDSEALRIVQRIERKLRKTEKLDENWQPIGDVAAAVVDRIKP